MQKQNQHKANKMENQIVFLSNKEVFTSSLIIAENLEVPHKVLLGTISKIVENQTKNNGTGMPLKFPPVFKEKTFTNKMNRTYPMYELNEQAFTKLVMNLSGYKKAEYIQDLFIEAFFEMKDRLLNSQEISLKEKRETGKAIRKNETDVIKEFVEYATKQGSKSAFRYYGNITKMTNKALEYLIQTTIGKPLKRDLMNIMELGFLQMLELRIIDVIKDCMQKEIYYKDIYQKAKEEVEHLASALMYKQLK